MTVQEFAAVTQRIIRQHGFARFLPVVCFPTRREIRALEGLPTGVDPEGPVLQWAAKLARPGEEYLVAFKISRSHFKIIRRAGRTQEQATFRAEAA